MCWAGLDTLAYHEVGLPMTLDWGTGWSNSVSMESATKDRGAIGLGGSPKPPIDRTFRLVLDVPQHELGAYMVMIS